MSNLRRYGARRLCDLMWHEHSRRLHDTKGHSPLGVLLFERVISFRYSRSEIQSKASHLTNLHVHPCDWLWSISTTFRPPSSAPKPCIRTASFSADNLSLALLLISRFHQLAKSPESKPPVFTILANMKLILILLTCVLGSFAADRTSFEATSLHARDSTVSSTEDTTQQLTFGIDSDGTAACGKSAAVHINIDPNLPPNPNEHGWCFWLYMYMNVTEPVTQLPRLVDPVWVCPSSG